MQRYVSRLVPMTEKVNGEPIVQLASKELDEHTFEVTIGVLKGLPCDTGFFRLVAQLTSQPGSTPTMAAGPIHSGATTPGVARRGRHRRPAPPRRGWF